MKRKHLLILIVLGIAGCLFSRLNYLELFGEEPRRAIVSMEMVLSGDYIVPHIDGWAYYNKPPLFNWVIAGLFKIFGSFDEWIVRTPSLLSLLLMAFINYFIVKKFVNKEVAIFSSLFFITSADIFFYGTIRSGEIDMFYSMLVYLQVMMLFIFHQRKRYLWMFVLSYLFAALGTLTKGPPSIAFQGITLLALLIYSKQIRLLFSWQHVVGIAVFLAVAGGYFYVYSFRNDAVPYMIQLCKEATMKSGFESKGGDLVSSSLIWPFNLLKILLPWSLFVVYLFSKRTRQHLRKNPLVAFSVLFIVANIPLYWFTALPNNRYIIMFFPFMMIILASAYDFRKLDWVKTRKIIETIFAVALFIIPVGILIAPWIKPTAQVDNALVKSIFLFIPAALVAWRYLKEIEMRIYYLALALIVLRIGSGLFVFQLIHDYSPEMVYRSHIEKMLSITDHKPIYLAGTGFEFTTDLSVGPLKFREEKIRVAGPLAYQVPYYYTKATGTIFQFEDHMDAGKYYLVQDDYLEGKNAIIYYSFVETYWHKTMCLAKLKE